MRAVAARTLGAFADQEAVITGGSEGIGYAVAAELAGCARRLTLLARDPEKLKRAAASLRSEWLAADVRSLSEVASSRLAQASLLVCCAGEMTPGRAAELTQADYQRQMDINFVGAVNCVRAALPHMVGRGGGTIVLVSSTAGLLGIYGYSAYGATKAAVANYAACLRAETASTGVRIVTAYPPDTETPGLRRERALRPAETEAIAGAIAAKSAQQVAARLVRGAARGQTRITFDATTAALVGYSSVIDRLFTAYSARRLRRIGAAPGEPRADLVTGRAAQKGHQP
ncbi:MAG: SDR family NAD(P)-dependent oxidoreductase [Mycobacteriaceae bacterium]|nr:SDR family NAD(P)-dependent oxidoreductase [Mycobacteriaceae bacterium]MBV9638704.1 SDR family NAD(P)-dependent oxidoreductase [Mycobacteriaceae bacterium]